MEKDHHRSNRRLAAQHTPRGLGLALGCDGVGVALQPTDRIADPTGPCLWHATFGIDGPTCGGTRMFYYLIHGNLLRVGQMQLPALIGLLYGGYALIAWTASWLLDKQLPVWKPGRWTIIGYIAFFLIWATVLRNLPWASFTWFYVPNLT
jgi:Protein of unknown function (DUF2752)